MNLKIQSWIPNFWKYLRIISKMKTKSLQIISNNKDPPRYPNGDQQILIPNCAAITSLLGAACAEASLASYAMQPPAQSPELLLEESVIQLMLSSRAAGDCCSKSRVCFWYKHPSFTISPELFPRGRWLSRWLTMLRACAIAVTTYSHSQSSPYHHRPPSSRLSQQFFAARSYSCCDEWQEE